MQETQVQSLGREYPLEKEMAPHSNILAREIPWTEEPAGLQSTGSQKSRAWQQPTLLWCCVCLKKKKKTKSQTQLSNWAQHRHVTEAVRFSSYKGGLQSKSVWIVRPWSRKLSSLCFSPLVKWGNKNIRWKEHINKGLRIIASNC